MDMDITIQLCTWDEYRSFSETLLNNGFINPKASHPEKFKHQETGQELDLLPFGEISPDGESITWPNDESKWSVVGIEDALEHALYLELTAGEQVKQVPFVSAPSLVMLKIIAIHDRPEDRYKKDSADIGFIIQNYLEIGNRDRLKDSPDNDIMSIVDNDLNLASAMLLGRDIKRIASETTRECLLKLLHEEITSHGRCFLARGLQKNLCNGDFNRAVNILKNLEDGIRG
jgi:predicted nucleotidyltransferase